GTWEMGDAVRGLAERLRAAGEPVHGPALFVCRHHVFGVGTFAVDAVLEGDAMVRAAGESGAAAAVLVGTISSCHGALNLLRIGAAQAAAGRLPRSAGRRASAPVTSSTPANTGSPTRPRKPSGVPVLVTAR